MSIQQNINFESYIPKDKFKGSKILNKKRLNIQINKIKEDIKKKKNVFHSFSKNFKLNFNLNELKRYKKFKRIIIIGMGGSILGTQAIHNFLKKNSKKELIFINNLSPSQTNYLKSLKDLKNSLFIIISKSGNTIEVLSIINFLKNKSNFNIKNSIVITENKKSHLSSFAKKFKLKIIFHRSYIGGRYSIFSETALVPCFFMGINIIKLRKNILNFLNKKKSLLLKNIIDLSKIYNSKKINSLVLLSYSEELKNFMLWYQQLIAESLGKKEKGIVPFTSVGPRDHHSLLQLFLDGPKDKFFYIFSIKKTSRIKREKGLFVKALNNSNINDLLDIQKNAMLSLLKIKKIPFLSLEIKKRDEQTFGELISYFILETVLIGEDLKINPFNQPAVEQLKILTKQKLLKKKQR
ncbi:glucose-6-phosphate isomerase [Pelagibacteraceae bacterium]|nr:glucose-6-phosphate isomerase [Pelagibacteraceae bacterium]